MNTFLPASYRFTPNKLLDANSKYKLIHPMNSTRVWGNLISIILFLLMIGVFIYIGINRGRILTSEAKAYIALMLILSLFLGIGVSRVIVSRSKPESYSSYISEQFKHTDKGNLSVCMLDNGSKPTKIDDHKPYPYELCYHSNNKYVCLGTMKNGKFTPGNEDPAPVFYKYYQYVQQHKLANKFKHDATLKRDGHYLTRNGKAQWVLTNNKDVILHLADNTKVKQTNIVKN